MSETDSFIEEVTEEVRRDRLYALFRKYGWIGGVLIAVIVGGTAWREWQAASAATRAEGFGDALLDALDMGAPEDRMAALQAAPASGGQGVVVNLLLAADPTSDPEAAKTALAALAGDAAQPEIYRDLATLKLVLLRGADQTVADRRASLDPLALPGRAFRVLALELQAYLLAEEGRTDEAIAAMTALLTDAQATSGQKGRLGQAIVALGGALPEEGQG